MAKKGRPKKVKKGRPKKVVPVVRVRKAKKDKAPKKKGFYMGTDESKAEKIKKPKTPKAPKPTTIKKPIVYKEEIVVLGKKVKRLHDGRDTDLHFHCGVDDGTTAHFDKELFKQ
jgi:hypothetical protein